MPKTTKTKSPPPRLEKVLKTDIPAETRPIVENYLSELGKRRRWHGQISLGYGYNSNVNQGNGINQCVWEISGMCLMERTLPAPTDSTFSFYSATSEKTIPAQRASRCTGARCAVRQPLHGKRQKFGGHAGLRLSQRFALRGIRLCRRTLLLFPAALFRIRLPQPPHPLPRMGHGCQLVTHTLPTLAY